MGDLTALQPAGGLLHGLRQRRATACTEAVEPNLCRRGGLEPLPMPTRLAAAGCDQRQTRPLPVRNIEDLRQKAFGLGKPLIAPSGRRSIDYHQPKFGCLSATRATQQIGDLSRPATQQSRQPADWAARTALGCAVAAIAESAWSRLSIRRLARARANA